MEEFFSVSLPLAIKNKLISLDRTTKQILVFAFDILALQFTLTLSFYFRLETLTFISHEYFWIISLTNLLSTSVAIYMFGIHRNVLRYVSIIAFQKLFFAILFGCISSFSIAYLLGHYPPRSTPVLYFALAVIFLFGQRIVMREVLLTRAKSHQIPIVIYGAGVAGRQLNMAIQQSDEYNSICFFDDDIKLQGSYVSGLKVKSPKDIEELISKFGLKVVILAIPSLISSKRREILKFLNTFPLEIKTLPSISDLIDGKVKLDKLKAVDVTEFLGRQTVPPILSLMSKSITNKCVLVSGAGGSIGSELCQEIISQNPLKLFLLDSSEFGLYKIYEKLKILVMLNSSKIELVPLLGSVQDENFLSKLFSENAIETIYHAAAFKHVPIVEVNAVEAIKNNVLGTYHIANQAKLNHVSNFILVSTDKAVRPTNYMGATKRAAELICQAFAQEKSSTCFSMVRFGNVMGSSGSVIPLFEEQIKNGGPITVTHREVTRFFMTINEAAQLVIQAGAMAKGGEVFVLDMGKQVKILDLAFDMARSKGLRPYLENEREIEGGIEIKITGLRAGEKLYEEKFIGKNAIATENQKILRAEEEFVSPKQLNLVIEKLNLAIKENSNDKPIEILKSLPLNFMPSLKR